MSNVVCERGVGGRPLLSSHVKLIEIESDRDSELLKKKRAAVLLIENLL